MGTYVDSDTDFSNVVIINSYRIVIGGTWTATLVNGVTMYSNSATGESYEGPINFVGITSLTISSGANANNIVIVKGTSQTTSPTITIASGGTLSQSTIFTSTVTVASGGLSTENAYVSSKITLSAGTVNSAGSVTRTGGATDADSFYQTSTTAKTSGTLTLSDGTSTSFQTSTGTGSLNASAQGVQINDPNIYGNGASTQVNTTNLGAGSYIGDPSIAVSQPYSQLVQGTYTITNSNFVGTSSSLGTPANRTKWTAAVKNGKTVYYCSTSSTRSPYYDGPINLMNINSLTIEAGAVVDGLFATGIGLITVTIAAGGTLQNSFINSANIINSGTSSGNTFVASTYTGQSGSTSTGDYMLSLGYSNINLNLSKATSNDPIVASTLNPTSSVTLNGTASFDSYAQNAGTVPTSSKTTPTFTFTSSGQATVGCFLAGTLINTVNGLIAVEHINVGDEIIAYTDGKEEIRSVIWVGHNTVTVNTYTPKDDANYPIRILKNAISDGVPFKDLLITPEHCVVFDGQFIPARMLVNNNSIFYDTSITEYTYYHIETEQHSIITADGVLTESYLDTGNRSGFISDENIVSIVNHHKEWNVDSAAPLVTARETVEPIFIRLTQRLPELGFELCESDAVTTHESNLYLLTNTGEEIYSNHQNNGRFFFKIPADTTQIQLISRTSRPSQVIGSFVDDRRDLGVLVGKVTLVEKHTAYSIIEHFTSETLQGWDIQEPINCRWTNGNGALNIRSEPSNNVAILVIEVLNAGPYLLTENSLEQKVA